jgi:hypothetical protein
VEGHLADVAAGGLSAAIVGRQWVLRGELVHIVSGCRRRLRRVD